MAYNHRQTGDSTLTLFLKRLGSIERSWDSFVGNLTHNSWFYIYFIAAPLKGRNTDFIKGHFAVAYHHKFPVFTLFVMVKCHLGSSIIIHCFLNNRSCSSGIRRMAHKAFSSASRCPISDYSIWQFSKRLQDAIRTIRA